jgi:hypothetical protein
MSDIPVGRIGNYQIIVRGDDDQVYEPEDGEQLGIQREGQAAQFGAEAQAMLQRLGLSQVPNMQISTLRNYISRIRAEQMTIQRIADAEHELERPRADGVEPNPLLIEGEVADAELPRFEDIDHELVINQVRELLRSENQEVDMSGDRYRRFHRTIARSVMDRIRQMPRQSRGRLTRLFRRELQQRGALLRGIAPERIVLEQIRPAIQRSHRPEESDRILRDLTARMRSRSRYAERLHRIMRRMGR